MDQSKINSTLTKLNCDWIEFNFNAPSASHMEGVWERQIRTVRSILSTLLKKNRSQLNDEELRTFMCEAEAVTRGELREALDKMDQSKINSTLTKLNCDWIEFNFNAPSASHMGGVWERQIRTVRSVLSALLKKNGSQLNDEGLRTFMCEAEAVINSHPLTTDNITSPISPEALTPNDPLTMKTKVVLPPPGVFQDADKYSQKQWQRVQHLTNEFWT